MIFGTLSLNCQPKKITSLGAKPIPPGFHQVTIVQPAGKDQITTLKYIVSIPNDWVPMNTEGSSMEPQENFLNAKGESLTIRYTKDARQTAISSAQRKSKPILVKEGLFVSSNVFNHKGWAGNTSELSFSFPKGKPSSSRMLIITNGKDIIDVRVKSGSKRPSLTEGDQIRIAESIEIQ